MELFAVILAGGSGARLWPLSQKDQPKHLLKLVGEDSLLQQTIKRLLRLLPPKQIFVVTHHEQATEVTRQIREMAPFPDENVLAEAESRNTLPAVMWAVRLIAEASPDAIVSVFPSDHLITGEAAFLKDLELAAVVARRGFLVTFGIRPSGPETGFGYIQAGPPLEGGARRTIKFLEKPDKATAETLLASGDYFWNSGMFVFTATALLEEVKQLHKTDAGNLPSVSIDVGVMEKSDKVAVIPASFGWSDLGSWEAVYQALEKDRNGNVLQGSILAEDTHSSLLISSQGLLATIGLTNIVAVRTGDAVLICPRDRSQDVKKIAGAPLKPVGTVTTERPWGRYTVLEEGPGYKIKRIVVDTAQKLSLQCHEHRAEHWVVIRGLARITNGEFQTLLKEGQSTFIPKGEKHRLENTGDSPLVIIEVQTGDYLGEDDIQRFDDIYGRKRS